MQTIVLNADYTYLSTVNWKRGVKLLVLEKAESLKESKHVVCNYDRTYVLKIPLVLKLISLVKAVYKNKVPYSRKNVFIRDGHQCVYCTTKNNLSIDHVLPSSRGGKTDFMNCVTSCVKCNVAKGNRTPEEAHMSLKTMPHEPTIMEFIIYKTKSTGVYKFLKEKGIY